MKVYNRWLVVAVRKKWPWKLASTLLVLTLLPPGTLVGVGATRAATSLSPNEDSRALLPSVFGPPDSRPGHYEGPLEVSFDVTDDQRVCKFRIKLPFDGGVCSFWVIGCMPIVDDAFGVEKEHPDLAILNAIGGTFDTHTHVTGEYSVSFCGSKVLPQPSEGTWEARKQ